jgi:Cu+-exporting ATPase
MVDAAKAKGVKFLPVTDFEAIEGHGIKATIHHKTVHVGNLRLMKKITSEDTTPFEKEMEKLEALAKTVMLIQSMAM